MRKQQKPSKLTQKHLLTNLHNLIKRIYEEKNILEELKESVLIMLSKKEDLRNCNTTKELCFCQCLAWSSTRSFRRVRKR